MKHKSKKTIFDIYTKVIRKTTQGKLNSLDSSILVDLGNQTKPSASEKVDDVQNEAHQEAFSKSSLGREGEEHGHPQPTRVSEYAQPISSVHFESAFEENGSGLLKPDESRLA
nr:hypothetical protein [Tanacetum cinerariifolium]